MQANRFVFSSPLRQVSNMGAIISEGFLLPNGGMKKSFSAFWKSES